jgi:integrase
MHEPRTRTATTREIKETISEETMKNKGGSVWKYIARNGERLWRYQFETDSLEGKRQRFSRAGFSTRGDARNALNAAIKDYQERKALPVEPFPAKETFADWVRAWLRDYGPERCQPKTLERYHALASYILDAKEGEPAKLAATPLIEADHKIIEAALRALLRMKAKRIAHLSPKTVREIAAVLSVSLNEAFRLEKIMINPLLRVRLPKVERVEARSLSPEEVRRLRDACSGDWTFVFIELALATGARRGELLALTWSDVDWLNSALSISKSLEETRAGGLRVKAPKNGKPRRFRIGQSVIASLQFQQSKVSEHRRLCGDAYQDNGLIFCKPDGAYFSPDLVSQAIIRRMKKAGIGNASLHSLRHTHASSLLSNGVPLPAVSARLGHADTNITARIYSHALPEDDVRAADAWENVVRGPIQ